MGKDPATRNPLALHLDSAEGDAGCTQGRAE
jgi:hypothetical protein